VGEQITDADGRLLPALLRFDAVHYSHFKCNMRRLRGFPGPWAYMRALYWEPGVVPTLWLDHIKLHYYGSHRHLNPSGIVPLGPDIDFGAPYGRGARGASTVLKNTDTTYGAVARGFHWLLFVLLTIAVIVGNLLDEIPKGPTKIEVIGLHKSLGVLILALVLLRLAWRLMNVRPADPTGTPPLQNKLAHAVHWLLYAVMLLQPISGILMSQVEGHPVGFFGLFQLPTLLAKNEALSPILNGAHATIWVVLVVLVIGHAAAALYHHYVMKDDVLRRMSLRPGT